MGQLITDSSCHLQDYGNAGQHGRYSPRGSNWLLLGRKEEVDRLQSCQITKAES